jgi:hypothetical protein
MYHVGKRISSYSVTVVRLEGKGPLNGTGGRRTVNI